jgi:hypothetical protein
LNSAAWEFASNRGVALPVDADDDGMVRVQRDVTPKV